MPVDIKKGYTVVDLFTAVKFGKVIGSLVDAMHSIMPAPWMIPTIFPRLPVADYCMGKISISNE